MRTRGVQDVIFVGTVTNTGQFIVHDAEIELIQLGVEELQDAWQGGSP